MAAVIVGSDFEAVNLRKVQQDLWEPRSPSLPSEECLIPQEWVGLGHSVCLTEGSPWEVQSHSANTVTDLRA